MSVQPGAVRAGRRKDALRLASHNLGGPPSAAGLEYHLKEAVSEWVDNGFHIITVQEVRASVEHIDMIMAAVNAAAIARATQHKCQHSGYAYRYCANSSSQHSAGTLVLWQRKLISVGSLQVLDPDDADYDPAGRLMCVRFKWGGHELQIGAVYCPNDSVERQQFITSVLGPAWQRSPNNSIFLGDWNFVEHPAVDRVSRSTSGHSSTSDAPSTHAWRAVAPASIDAYRLLHPTTRAYTFYATNRHIARLDRVYVSPALQQYVLECRALPSSVSDHHPVLLGIAPRVPSNPKGPGLKRARYDFVTSPPHWQAFMAQLTAELQYVPTSDALLLQWWPGFKARMLTTAIAVRKQWVKDIKPPSFKQAREQVTAAVERLGSAVGEQQTNVALDAVALAQLQLRNIQQSAWQHSWRAQRQQWVHQGEQPNPAITQQLKALGGSHQQHVIGLRSAAGTFVWEGAGPADIAIAQWAGVSTQPTVDPAAQTHVLDAVRNLPRHPVAANGSPTVSVAEVKRALSGSKPGKSPGLDGLPVIFYKYCIAPMLPLLARVFTAIGNLACTPAGFLDGVIVGIFKEGTNDPTLAASYRPITLLNIDYRLLAKIMAERLQVVLDKAISPTQTAFVRGR